MRILIVDDERDFAPLAGHTIVQDHASYLSLSENDNKNVVYYVRNYKDAQWMMPSGWDIVYLDHDLGDGKNGYDICSEIEKHAFDGYLLNIGKFVIHSANPLGRMRMYEALHKFYNVEFARAEDLV